MGASGAASCAGFGGSAAGTDSCTGADFSATLDTVPLQEDYLAAGAGVWVGFAERWSVVLDYEGHYFRGDSNAHYASLRIGLDL